MKFSMNRISLIISKVNRRVIYSLAILMMSSVISQVLLMTHFSLGLFVFFYNFLFYICIIFLQSVTCLFTLL